MGNKGSKLNADKVSEISEEVMTSFSKEFSNAYKDCIIDKIKNDHKGDGPVKQSYKLTSAPTADQFIKTGYLIKLGGQVHNWKRRYFIAMNKADNYAIVYSENESTSTVKGKFYCCGFTVVPFNKEELNTYGIYGMKLTPPDPTKRQWIVRAKTAEEYREWFEVFSNACRKTKPQSNPDPMKERAFRSAYQTLRMSYGYFGYANLFGSQTEQLEVFLYTLLRRELIDSYLMSIQQESRGKSKEEEVDAEEMAVQSTMAAIKPLIASNWRESSQSVDAMASSFEASVIPLYEAYVDLEAQLLELMNERIDSLMNPVIDDAVLTIIKPIFTRMSSKIVAAYEKAFERVLKALEALIDQIADRPDCLAQEIKAIDATLELIDGGPLAQTQVLLRQFINDDLSQIAPLLERANMIAYDVYLDLIENNRSLARNAIHTFHGMVSVAMISNPESPMLERRSPSTRSPSFRFDNDGPSKDSPLAMRHPSISGSRLSPAGGNPLAKKRQSSILLPAALRPKLIEIFNDVITLYSEDIKLSIQITIKDLIIKLMEANIEERILIPCQELAIQSASRIPKNMTNIVSIAAIIERKVRKTVNNTIEAIMAEHDPDISLRLEMMCSKLVLD